LDTIPFVKIQVALDGNTGSYPNVNVRNSRFLLSVFKIPNCWVVTLKNRLSHKE